MASSTHNVLVFGPTGGVGRAAALAARKHGATVWLAMRDTSKSIPGLDDSEPGYHRVQADLMEPSSLAKAVQQSGAKTAFVYCMMRSSDSMASSFVALKDAGITYVVLLSSYTVQGAAHDEINTVEFLSKVHAQHELALEKSGIAYAAVRPMYFASNVTWNKEAIKAGVIELVYPDSKLDFITPSDIGAVCGAVLAEPRFQQPDKDGAAKTIYLCGPQLITQRRAHEIIAEKLHHDLEVKEIDEETWFKKNDFLPRPVLQATANLMKKKQDDLFPPKLYDEAVGNVKKYTGAEPLEFGPWVEANKELFA
jgi:uncharacterized protein YbjT (DUF2867 family)